MFQGGFMCNLRHDACQHRSTRFGAFPGLGNVAFTRSFFEPARRDCTASGFFSFQFTTFEPTLFNTETRSSSCGSPCPRVPKRGGRSGSIISNLMLPDVSSGSDGKRSSVSSSGDFYGCSSLWCWRRWRVHLHSYDTVAERPRALRIPLRAEGVSDPHSRQETETAEKGMNFGPPSCDGRPRLALASRGLFFETPCTLQRGFRSTGKQYLATSILTPIDHSSSGCFARLVVPA